MKTININTITQEEIEADNEANYNTAKQIKDTDKLKFTGYPKRMWCWDIDEEDGEEVFVFAERLNVGYNKYPYLAISDDGTYNAYINAKELSENQTLKDLKQGDIIYNDCTEQKVLGICGDVISVSVNKAFDKFGFNFTLTQLKELNLKIKK
jgi:hypothetical protein